MTKLLLVDDEQDNLLLFKDVLNEVGFIVDAYYDPVQALLSFKLDYYDLLILDYIMPRINGLELFEKIREIDRTSKLMLLTASHEQLEPNNVQDQLKFKIIRKPVTITNSFRRSCDIG